MQILLLMVIIVNLCFIKYPVIALAEQNDMTFEEKNGCEEFECLEISTEEAN